MITQRNWLFIGFCLFKKNYRLIAADLSKQKALNADSRAIQQISFKYRCKDLLHFWTIKRNSHTVFQRNNKSSVININSLNTIK